MMAQNVEWLLKEAYPKEKIVLWAHNGHVSTAPSAGFRPMGSWLRESLGSEMYVLGFAINSGTVRAMTRAGGRSIGLAESKIPASSEGTGTGTLSAAGNPLFFLDVRNSKGALAKWAADPHLFRECGAVWDRDNPESFMRTENLRKSFDGLIYLDSTAAARGIKR
jgi:erythromycin esterase